jgi:hypothetical protein
MMRWYGLAIILLLWFTVGIASAAPTTSAATMIGNNNFTMNGNGAGGGTGWFQWSMATGREYAHTPNVTTPGGTYSYTMSNSPILGSTVYYYKACDTTGCGAEVSLTTAAVTPIPVPNYDAYAQNMTENHLDPINFIWNTTRAYTMISGDTILYGLIFAMLLIGMWLRTRGTQTAMMFGMMFVCMFTVSAGGLAIGLPPEFLAAGQALMYISLTGAIVMFTFK